MSNDTNVIEKKVDKAKRKVKMRKDVKILIISLLVIIVICIATFITYKQYQDLNEYDIFNLKHNVWNNPVDKDFQYTESFFVGGF